MPTSDNNLSLFLNHKDEEELRSCVRDHSGLLYPANAQLIAFLVRICLHVPNSYLGYVALKELNVVLSTEKDVSAILYKILAPHDLAASFHEFMRQKPKGKAEDDDGVRINMVNGNRAENRQVSA